MTSPPYQWPSSIGGLSSLVEAAMRVDTCRNSEIEQRSRPPQKAPGVNVVVSDDDDEMRKTKVMARNPKDTFPQRLLSVLADISLSEIVSWLPHGKSFVIIRPVSFSEQVLPKYFPSNDIRSSTKYASFTRKLNRWGFRQTTRGPDTGAFHHPLFRRDDVRLCLDMVCQKSRKRNSTKSPNEAKYDIPMPPIAKTSTVCQNKKIMVQKSCIVNQRPTTLTAQSLASLSVRSAICSAPSSSCTTSQVSADDKSVSSPATPITLMFAFPQAMSTPHYWITPTNRDLVASTLKDWEERERLIVYKSLLRDAYLKAVSAP